MEVAQEEQKQVETAKKKTIEEMEEENNRALEELFLSEPPEVDESERKEVEEKLPILGERRRSHGCGWCRTYSRQYFEEATKSV